MLVAVAPATRGVAATENEAPITQIGTLERFPAEAVAAFGENILPPPDNSSDLRAQYGGTLLPLLEAGQLWQVWPYPSLGGTNMIDRAAIAVRDPRTLRIVRTFKLNHNIRRGTKQASGGGEWLHAFDPRGRRVFLVVDERDILEIDLDTFIAKPAFDFWMVGTPEVGPAGDIPKFIHHVGGVTYDSFTDSLVGLVGGPAGQNIANVNTFIYKRDLRTGVTTGPRALSSCTGAMPSTDQGQTYGFPVLPTADAFYVPCHRAGMVATVVRLDRATAFSPNAVEDSVPGPIYMEAAFPDPSGERLFVVTNRGEIWAFDLGTMSFVGVVGTHPPLKSNTPAAVGYGFDPQTGRVFFQSPAYGFGVVEGRFFPLPQAITLPSATADGQERIVSDEASGRVFVLEGTYSDRASRNYKIYRVAPASAPPAPPDPDRSTVDRDEEPGITRSRYFANGSGYGFRALLPNGVATVLPAPTVGALAPTTTALRSLYSKCGFTDRDLFAGRVAKAEYDNGSTAASAVAVDIDDRTKQDLLKPSRCDLAAADDKKEVFSGIFATAPEELSPFDRGPGWNRDPAVCSTSEGGQEQEAVGDDHDQAALGKSRVECPVPGSKLEAAAEASMAGGIAVGKARSQVTIRKTAQGVVSEAVAVARDIEIAEVIRIEEIRSTATSRANGRPGQADLSSHTVAMKGVRIGDQVLCPDVCRDMPAVITELNRFAVTRMEFRLASGLDGKLRKGTPRGSLTAVKKSEMRQASDQALVGDFTADIPALEMTIYNDNHQWGRARQIYRFAAVSTVAGYTIAMEPTGLGFDDDPGGSFADDPIAALDSGGGFPEASGLSDSVALAGSDGEGESGGGPLMRALRAIGRGLELILTSPRNALLVGTIWLVLSMPAALARRRRLLDAARVG